MSEGQKPEMSFKAGGVEAAIWRNEYEGATGKFDRFSVTLRKTYKDKEGKWQVATNWQVNDLPKVALVIGRAYEYCSLRPEPLGT